MMSHLKKLSLCICFLIVIAACSTVKHAKVNRAFYFWKSYNLTDFEEHQLDVTAANKLYVKIFEIKLDELEGSVPVSKTYLKLPTGILNRTEIVPCIFIENEVIANSTNAQLDELAKNTSFLAQKFIDSKLKEFKEDDLKCNEIQIDCDWMESSKEQYFYFLTALKKHTFKTISCTLRLYPYKFKDKMGVPPVNRVMLLCYNLLNPQSDINKNSILDISELKKYVKTKKNYPLPVDVTLPMYSSCYVFTNAKFDEVHHGIPNDLEDICLPSEDDLWYVVKKDTSIRYNYYRKGQRLKIERVRPSILIEASKLIIKNVNLAEDVTVGLYNLDDKEFKNYTHATMDSVYMLFDQR